MSNLQECKVHFYNKVEIMTIDQSSQSSGSSKPSKQWQLSCSGGNLSSAVSNDDQMDWMEDVGQIPPPYVPEVDIDLPDNDNDLDQIAPPAPTPTDILARSDVDDTIEDIWCGLEELEEEQDPPPVPASADVNEDRLRDLEEEQDPPSVPTSPSTSIAGLENGSIQWQPHPSPEPVPSHVEKMEIEHERLVNPGAAEEVFCVIYEMKLHHHHTHLHYKFRHDACLDQHILEAMRINLIKEARKALTLLDAMEASKDPYKTLGFSQYSGKEENQAWQSVAEMVHLSQLLWFIY
ncbi:hypothetical protein EDC04DRAFT_2597988 [Pisolithus marmoratus]|nr:hypothetical protein EDC04DRAFT_2597988 [Pisolithus marmoratus]